MTKCLCGLLLVLLFAACHSPQVPESFTDANVLPKIYPDYADVTVPVNIAPLCFELLNDADEAVTRFSAGADEMVCEGRKVRPDIGDWHSMLQRAAGRDITVEVYAKKDGQWLRFQQFAIHISPDSIDPWLSYRLISPSYVSYEELTINQRCLENFDESVIADNMLCSTEKGGQCINCHSFQQNNPERFQLHARQANAGTIIVYDGKLKKLQTSNLKPQTSNLKPTPVYPAWHPYLKLIAYSTNKTMQSFHTSHTNKIEVYDSSSSLLLYDIDADTMSIIEDMPNELETFPAWSPDGRSLYFCSVHFEYETDAPQEEEITLRVQELKYSIYRKTFDPDTRTFGQREPVFPPDSSLITHHSSLITSPISSLLPRISPDGRWLLFTAASYGTFPIWHHDADLWLMDLSTGEARPLSEANSNDTESYHSWSSNGRWVVFSSRRYDGVFTRPFFTHIDADGHASKPFELPSADPDYHLQLLKSYNVPELMTGPVRETPHSIAAKLKEE